MYKIKLQRDLLSIYVALFISSLGFGIVIPLIPLLVEKTGANSFDIGLIATTMAVSFTFSSIPIGRAIDKIGSRLIITLGLILYGSTMLVLPMLTDLKSFFILRVIEGIGSAAIWIGVETYINLISNKNERSKNMGYYGMSVGLGLFGGPMVGMSFSQQHLFIPFLFVMIACLISAMVVHITLNNHISSSNPLKLHFSKQLSILRIPLASSFTYGFAEASLVALFPIYLQSMDIEGLSMGILISLFMIGGLLAQVPFGMLADSVGKKPILLFTGFVSFILLSFFQSIGEHLGLEASALFTGFFMSAIYPVSLSMIGDLVSEKDQGLSNATFTSLFGFGSITGPIITGITMSYMGNYSLLSILGIVFSIYTLIILFLIID